MLFGWIYELFVRTKGMDFINEFNLKDIDSLKIQKWNLRLVVKIQKAGRGDLILYPSKPTGVKEADKMEMRFRVLKAGWGDFISYPSIPAGFKEADIMEM